MSIVDRVLDRSVADAQERNADEVRRIMDAAYTVIARTGDVDPPIRSILREAGLSNPAFYRYFRGKDELMLAVLDDGRRRLHDYLDRRIAAAGDGARVDAWVRGVLIQAANHRAAERTRPFVVDVGKLHAQYPAAQSESEQMLLDQLHDLVPDASRAEVQAAYTLVIGELERHLRNGTAPRRGDVDAVATFVERGLGTAG